jgi:hypothetical protein
MFTVVCAFFFLFVLLQIDLYECFVCCPPLRCSLCCLLFFLVIVFGFVAHRFNSSVCVGVCGSFPSVISLFFDPFFVMTVFFLLLFLFQSKRFDRRSRSALLCPSFCLPTADRSERHSKALPSACGWCCTPQQLSTLSLSNTANQQKKRKWP